MSVAEGKCEVGLAQVGKETGICAGLRISVECH